MDEELKQRLAMHLAISAVLRAVETINREIAGDLTAGLVFLAVLEANVGHLSADRAAVAQLQRIDRLPPDNMRRPVSGAALSTSLGVPNETVRRKIKQLIDQGLLERVSGGLIVPAEVLARPQMTRVMRAGYVNLRRLLTRIQRIGLDTPEENAA